MMEGLCSKASSLSLESVVARPTMLKDLFVNKYAMASRMSMSGWPSTTVLSDSVRPESELLFIMMQSVIIIAHLVIVCDSLSGIIKSNEGLLSRFAFRALASWYNIP